MKNDKEHAPAFYKGGFPGGSHMAHGRLGNVVLTVSGHRLQ